MAGPFAGPAVFGFALVGFKLMANAGRDFASIVLHGKAFGFAYGKTPSASGTLPGCGVFIEQAAGLKPADV